MQQLTLLLKKTKLSSYSRIKNTFSISFSRSCHQSSNRSHDRNHIKGLQYRIPPDNKDKLIIEPSEPLPEGSRICLIIQYSAVAIMTMRTATRLFAKSQEVDFISFNLMNIIQKRICKLGHKEKLSSQDTGFHALMIHKLNFQRKFIL
jgi:hypothetical protein